MASFWDRVNPLSGKSWTMPIANKSFRNGASNLLFGTPEKRENVSTLRPEQEPNFQNLQNAAQNRGAGGAFGQSADYYRDLLGNDSADFNAFAAPQLRQYYEDTVPNISEQFAGMGSGGLSSSGFQNAQVQGGVDLAERLGAIRANLRQAGAQGLQNIGTQSLGNFSQNMVTQPGSEGLLAPALGALGTAFAGPPGGALGTMGGKWLQNSFGGSNVGTNSSPYGNLGSQGSMPASPQIRR